MPIKCIMNIMCLPNNFRLGRQVPVTRFGILAARLRDHPCFCDQHKPLINGKKQVLIETFHLIPHMALSSKKKFHSLSYIWGSQTQNKLKKSNQNLVTIDSVISK